MPKFLHLSILIFSAKAESCATNLNLQTSLGLGRGRESPATSPLSENKSFDSAVSSGIRSGDFLDHSASDLARFDLRINESPRPSQPSERVMLAPLRRTCASLLQWFNSAVLRTGGDYAGPIRPILGRVEP